MRTATDIGRLGPGGAPARPPRGVRMGAWHRTVLSLMRRAYFGSVRVGGVPAPPRRRPRIVLASHRNGALDGAVVQAAFPCAQYLVSMQLMRGPLKLLATGIPVVRQRDVERYRMDRSAVTDPVSASADHVMAGGDLVIFPEGTSTWGSAPGPYHRGAAKIWCRLRREGIEVDVIPLGLMYSAPERFSSLAEIWLGAALDIPEPGDGELSDGEERVHQAMTRGLDAVSVRCADPATFDRVQQRATARARAGESFAEAFLEEQDRARRQARAPRESECGTADPALAARPSPWPRRFGLALTWLFAPVLLAAWAAGRAADARNTVSFFRVLGGTAATLIWVPLLAIVLGGATALGAGPMTATVIGAGLACAALGRAILRARRWQPDTAPLSGHDGRAAADTAPEPDRAS